MKTTVDIDLTINASEEAKICLNCDKPKCIPYDCDRLKKIKQRSKRDRVGRRATPK